VADSRQYFAEVYDRTFGPVTGYIAARCENLGEVEDIVQSVYLAFYRHISTDNRDIDNPEAYLKTIGRHQLAVRYQKKQKQPPPVYAFDDLPDMEDPDSGTDFCEMLENRELSRQIWEDIARFPRETARCFALYYLREMSLKQVAQELDMTESNVKNHIYRGLKKLRERYADA